MSDIHIHRAHDLGLARARKIALRWAEEVEERFSMECTIIEGPKADVVEFTRSGVSGTLDVSADHFELKARFGLLLGVFAKNIEAEIEKNLDELLAESAKSAPARKARK